MTHPGCEHMTDLGKALSCCVHRTLLGMTKSELLRNTKLINRMRDYRLLDETQVEPVVCISDGYSSGGNLTSLAQLPFKVRRTSKATVH